MAGSHRAAVFCACSVLAVAVLLGRRVVVPSAVCALCRSCGRRAVGARRVLPRAGLSPSAPAAAPLRALVPRSLQSAWACLAARNGALIVAKKKQPTPPIIREGGAGCTIFFSVFLSGGPIKRTPKENHARRYNQEVDPIVSRFCELVKHNLRDNPRKLVELIVGDYRISKRIQRRHGAVSVV